MRGIERPPAPADIGSMGANRATGALLVAAVGAAVLLVATFQPWYAVRTSPAGAAVLRQQHVTVVSGSGHLTARLTARQALTNVSTALIVLAGLALFLSALRLGGVIEGSGGGIAAFGLVAACCVGFRMWHPPNPAPGYIAFSLSWGSWFALLGALAVVVGGLRSPYSRLL